MIVSHVADPLLRQAVRAAAHPDEEVVTDATVVAEALQSGFPRLLVRAGPHLREGAPSGLPVLDLDDVLLRRWEAERRAAELPEPRVDHLASRLRVLVARPSSEPTWVDRALADMARASGWQLPGPLRTFARRVLEFPSRYATLHELSDSCGLTRGALKARFRRRGLASPYTYLRWFRIMAVAHVLSDRSVTVAHAAHRLGFTSSGNLCRVTESLAGTTPTELRTVHGWNRLVIRFAWEHLGEATLDAWATLDGLFKRRVA
jgi:AraC-like DNA-binding protein